MKSVIIANTEVSSISTRVVVHAIHPNLGPLYWEVIQENKVGRAVTFSITDCIDSALQLEVGWRGRCDEMIHQDHMKNVVRDLVAEYRVLEIDGWYDKVEYAGNLEDLALCSGQGEVGFLNWLKTAVWTDIPAPDPRTGASSGGDVFVRLNENTGGNDEITVWECGRLAATNGSRSNDNPYHPETWNHDEWNRGFANGKAEVKPQAVLTGDTVVVPLPVRAVEFTPDASVWEEANRLQMSYGLGEDQLAEHFGITCDRLRTGMIHHNYWDDDAIPLGIREAS